MQQATAECVLPKSNDMKNNFASGETGKPTRLLYYLLYVAGVGLLIFLANACLFAVLYFFVRMFI